jgi:hypothetical protein
VVVAIRSSSLKSQELKAINEAENIPHRKLSLDVITRWNSTFEMLKRVDESRYGIESLGFHNDVNPDEELWMGKDSTNPDATEPAQGGDEKEPTLEIFHTDWDVIGDLIPVGDLSTFVLILA